MDDQADVGFVDAHAESDGGHDDVRFVTDEGFLIVFALVVGEACVVRDGADPFGLEHFSGGGYAFAAGPVDDGGFAGAAFEQGQELGVDVVFEADVVEEVGAVEGGANDEGGAQGKFAENILLNPVGCRCGEGGDGDAGKEGDEVGEGEVVGAEVVPPFGDTVGFVDDGHAELHASEGFAKVAEDEAFGRDVEEVERVGEEIAHDLVAFVGGLGAVEEGGADAVCTGAVDLVFHECDEGADDHAGAGEEDGG